MRRIFIIGISAAAAILLAVVIALAVALNSANQAEAPMPTAPTQVERTVSGKSIEEDRADVLNAAVELLEATGAPLGATDYQTYMDKVETGEITYSEDLLKRIRFVDSLNEDSVKRTLLQSLATFANMSKQSTGTDAITTLYENSDDAVVVDQEAGVAYVPTTLFINSTTGLNGFSFEFVYIDGEWKFAPYMTLDQLRLALVYNGVTADQ